MQAAIVTATIIAAVIYLAWRIRKTFAHGASPCDNCAGCPLKDRKQSCKVDACNKIQLRQKRK